MIRLDMASPKPVPPFLRVIALSACWNSAAAFGCYGGAGTKLPAENDDARADEFCAPTENSTDFEIFDNSREAKSIV
jgi:hypothetical protein